MYEYHTENVKEYLGTELLHELGKQGWYLVTIYKDTAYFVRLHPSDIDTSVAKHHYTIQLPIEN